MIGVTPIEIAVLNAFLTRYMPGNFAFCFILPVQLTRPRVCNFSLPLRMLIAASIIGGILILAGLGRALYKGQYTSLRNFLLTVFFLDLVFDADDFGSDVDSDTPDIDF